MGEKRQPSRQALSMLVQAKPVPSHPREAEFEEWYQRMSAEHNLNPNPNAEGQKYDYRSAMMAGQSPDVMGHWPSQDKEKGHPNEVVSGFNTRTGERVPGAPLARSVEEMIIQGWDPQTAQHLWNSVKAER